jgi:hypothetical protein
MAFSPTTRPRIEQPTLMANDPTISTSVKLYNGSDNGKTVTDLFPEFKYNSVCATKMCSAFAYTLYITLNMCAILGPSIFEDFRSGPRV